MNHPQVTPTLITGNLIGWRLVSDLSQCFF
jgi:hypothetical protein